MLDAGGSAFSTDQAEGRVGLAVYPWEVALARTESADSAVNHVRGEVRSLVALGNRVRVRVGPLTAEVTAASAERLALAEGERVVASFKATATPARAARLGGDCRRGGPQLADAELVRERGDDVGVELACRSSGRARRSPRRR